MRFQIHPLGVLTLQVPMSRIPDMTQTPAVAPRTGKLLKMVSNEEKICYTMVYYTLHLR